MWIDFSRQLDFWPLSRAIMVNNMSGQQEASIDHCLLNFC